LSHVSDAALAGDLAAAAARDRASTAILLAHIAEFDARKLYLPAAHPSMFSYCVGELRLSEDAAYKRIQSARAARKFPAIFEAVADGRLHLTAIVMLGPWLTPENAGELLAAATHKSKPEIELLLATRFPQPDLPARVEAISAGSNGQLVPEPVGDSAGAMQLVPEPVEAPGQRPKLQPLAADRYGIQFTADRETYDLLGYAQALLGHGLPSGDLAQVFKRALKVLVCQLEKRKFAASSRSRPRTQRRSASPRHIPAAVKRAVRERDQDQCTFRSESGKRCPARTRLEFDHIEPVARGGVATVDGMRLRCRAHNQYAAECAFGAGFMARKREEARAAAAAAKRKQAAEEVIPYLRTLGFRTDESRAAATLCERDPDGSLERRVKLALTYFANRHCTRWKPAAAVAAPA
jgi:hypothetical protein